MDRSITQWPGRKRIGGTSNWALHSPHENPRRIEPQLSFVPLRDGVEKEATPLQRLAAEVLWLAWRDAGKGVAGRGGISRQEARRIRCEARAFLTAKFPNDYARRRQLFTGHLSIDDGLLREKAEGIFGPFEKHLALLSKADRNISPDHDRAKEGSRVVMAKYKIRAGMLRESLQQARQRRDGGSRPLPLDNFLFRYSGEQQNWLPPEEPERTKRKIGRGRQPVLANHLLRILGQHSEGLTAKELAELLPGYSENLIGCSASYLRRVHGYPIVRLGPLLVLLPREEWAAGSGGHLKLRGMHTPKTSTRPRPKPDTALLLRARARRAEGASPWPLDNFLLRWEGEPQNPRTPRAPESPQPDTIDAAVLAEVGRHREGLSAAELARRIPGLTGQKIGSVVARLRRSLGQPIVAYRMRGVGAVVYCLLPREAWIAETITEQTGT